MAEKNFKYFLELPAKHRMKIIDAMKPDDRCRFTRTSKSCNVEAKSSKKYMECIEFEYVSENELKILMEHGGYDRTMYGRKDLSLEFKKEVDNQKFMICIKIGGGELWRILLTNSTNLVEFAVECFKNLLQLHQGQIKKLDVHSWGFSGGVMFDIGDIRFERLEHLTVRGEFNTAQFITNTCRPLKSLTATTRAIVEYPMEKMYQVQDLLFISFTPNNDHFLRLSAATVIMDIGDITEDCIFNFVRSWQNGTIGRKLKWFQLNLKNPKFDMKRLFHLFGDYKYSDRSSLYQLHVPHFINAGGKARVSRVMESLQLYFYDKK